jgi:hypothetical protein
MMIIIEMSESHNSSTRNGASVHSLSSLLSCCLSEPSTDFAVVLEMTASTDLPAFALVDPSALLFSLICRTAPVSKPRPQSPNSCS